MVSNSTSDRKELILIDGNSLAYRAFFALPESIATSDGRPTNAIFGFASMLVKLIDEHGSLPTIVVWDRGLSGRKELYPEYKAQREKKPDLLREQWSSLSVLVEAFGYRNVAVEGYEADDVIASIAERARLQHVPTLIVTGDRDAFQLIDEAGFINVLATTRGVTDTVRYDTAAVVERYGISPEYIPDFYGLKGDSSDNIPGVPGIGEKTAAQLLQKYQTLENILGHIDDIAGEKRRQNLTQYADDARMSKELARIQRDVEVSVDPKAELEVDPDRSQLREVFRSFELRDPLRRAEMLLGLTDEDQLLNQETGVTNGFQGTIHAANLTTIKLAAGQEIVAACSEQPPAEGELFAEQVGWQFALLVDQKVYFGEVQALSNLVDFLMQHKLICHDAKSQGLGECSLVFDTALAAYLLEPVRRSYDLAELCESYTPVQHENQLVQQVLQIHWLAEQQRAHLDELSLGSVFHTAELPLVSVLRRMEKAGVRMSVSELQAISQRVKAEIQGLEQEVYQLAGETFTIGSPQQLAKVLFEQLGLSRKRRGKTGYSTDARVLSSIREEHPIVPKIERWRELNTLVKTYLDVLPTLVDGQQRIHTTFLQTVAATGRLSSTQPNLQNIPIRTTLGKEIRRCFEAAPGNALLSIDYSQVELRILAHVADEPVLKKIFAAGNDVHTATAAQVFHLPVEEVTAAQRSKAKMVNYGIVYGLTDFGLADRLGISRQEAKEFIDVYFEQFPRVKAFIDGTITRTTNDGFVTTLWGRRRAIPELRASNWQVRSHGERLAVNTVVQGTAADIVKLAMIACDDVLTSHTDAVTKLVLTIHDELLFDGPEDELQLFLPKLTQAMTAMWEHTPTLTVDAGIGHNWLEAKG